MLSRSHVITSGRAKPEMLAGRTSAGLARPAGDENQSKTEHWADQWNPKNGVRVFQFRSSSCFSLGWLLWQHNKKCVYRSTGFTVIEISSRPARNPTIERAWKPMSLDENLPPTSPTSACQVLAPAAPGTRSRAACRRPGGLPQRE